MAKPKNIAQLARYIQKTRNDILRAHAESLLKIVTDAEAQAKKNAVKQFIGRNGRKLSGRLLNSIYSGFETTPGNKKLPTGFVGTRGIPYGRIHELGGTITPKKAKYLWIKDHTTKKFRRMTPSEFVQKMKSGDSRFKILRGPKGAVAVFQARKTKKKKESVSDFLVLFRLTKKVVMPKRPYLQPAVDKALLNYRSYSRRIMNKFLRAPK